MTFRRKYYAEMATLDRRMRMSMVYERMTSTELAERFHVSARTVGRDLMWIHKHQHLLPTATARLAAPQSGS